MTYGMISTARADYSAPNYGRNADGYGRKIPTRYWVRLAGERRERRVYAICFSNAASLYVVRNGEDIFINETDLEVELLGQ